MDYWEGCEFCIKNIASHLKQAIRTVFHSPRS
jgi:hypothetical protein